MPKRSLALAWRVSFPRHKAIDLLRRAIQASSSAYWNYNTARSQDGPGRHGGKPELVMKPLSKIVIVGGGTSGWLAASMLCQHLKRELCEIELVESEELGTIGVGESTVPPFVGLIHRLGIDENEFVRATDATYKLGIKFVGWHERSDSYFHPFGVIGKPIGNHDFYQCWLKARAQGDTSALQDFSPCNVMAEQGRFFHPAKARNTPIGGANYALHVDALLVAKYLRKYSEERGLKRTEGKVVEVAQRDERLHRERDAGERRGGPRRTSSSTAPASRPCSSARRSASRASTGRTTYPAIARWPARRRTRARSLPYTRATRAGRPAGAGAFRCSIASATATCIRASSRATRPRSATLLRSLDSACIEEPRVIPYTTGHRKQFWKHELPVAGPVRRDSSSRSRRRPST